MKIVLKYKIGLPKGYSIRKSKYGWFSVYSENGVCQSAYKLKTFREAKNYIKSRFINNN